MVVMKNFGQTLAQARKKENYTIEKLAETTKIKKSFLIALENNDITPLPKQVFALGFIRILAKTLKLDEKELKEAFLTLYPEEKVEQTKEEETDIRHVINESNVNIPELLEKVLSKKVIIPIVSVIVIVSGFKLISNFVHEIQEESKRRTGQTVEKEDTPQLKPQSDDLFDLKASKKLREETIAQEPKKIEKEAPQEKVEPKEELVKEEQKEEIKDQEINLRPMPKNLFSLDAEAAELKDASIFPPSIKNAYVDGKQNVFINAIEEDTWISFKIDDEDIRKFVLKKGRTFFMKGDKILLLMGNINASKVFLNNQLVVTNSKSGVKSLVFPESESENHRLPLFISVNGKLESSDKYIKN